MKRLLSILLLGFAANISHAQEPLPMVLQVKYSPWGKVVADTGEFEWAGHAKYEMDFERSLGLKLILPNMPIYLGAQQNVTHLGEQVPDAKLETFAVGLGGIVYDPYAHNSSLYLLGSLGAGVGLFKFKDPELDDYEAMFEANAELGLRIYDNLLLGIGVDYQLFGEPRDTKAQFWNLYVSTGVTF